MRRRQTHGLRTMELTPPLSPPFPAPRSTAPACGPPAKKSRSRCSAPRRCPPSARCASRGAEFGGDSYARSQRRTASVCVARSLTPSLSSPQDLYVLRRAVGGYERLVKRFTAQTTDYQTLLSTFAEGLYTELDFRNEALNNARMQELLDTSEFAYGDKIVIPKPVMEMTSRCVVCLQCRGGAMRRTKCAHRFCAAHSPTPSPPLLRRRVLTMEWIEGVKLTTLTPEEIRDLVKVGQEAFLVQLLEVRREAEMWGSWCGALFFGGTHPLCFFAPQIGFFHGDPHPGEWESDKDRKRAVQRIAGARGVGATFLVLGTARARALTRPPSPPPPQATSSKSQPAPTPASCACWTLASSLRCPPPTGRPWCRPPSTSPTATGRRSSTTLSTSTSCPPTATAASSSLSWTRF